MNWIQQHILVELTRHPSRRYSEMRPEGVEGNLFLYHLDGLIKDGLVEKNEKKYTLTPKGLELASTLSLGTGKTRKQPQVLTAIACKNDQDEYLFSRWHRQPNTGLVSFPHGMVHFGETLPGMAALELAEKANLTADLSYLGMIELRVMSGQDVSSHMLVHIFVAANTQELSESSIKTDVSEPFWSKLSKLKAEDFVPGFYELAQIVDAHSAKEYIFTAIDIT